VPNSCANWKWAAEERTMSLFQKEVAAPEPDMTGTEAIRARVWSRWKRANLSRTAMDLNISLANLEAFARGEGKLPEAALHALTKEFFYHARFDPVADRLVDVSPPAKVAATVTPEPWKNPDAKVQKAHDDFRAALKAARGPDPAPPRPEKSELKRPDPSKRPGFV
jgi:hypothetical protein